jgi:hypothetical protein
MPCWAVGDGLSPNRTRWIGCKPGFFLHVRVLSRLFHRLFIAGLLALHRADKLAFFGDQVGLSDADTFTGWLAPFGGPEGVLAYLSRYTHPTAWQLIA